MGTGASFDHAGCERACSTRPLVTDASASVLQTLEILSAHFAASVITCFIISLIMRAHMFFRTAYHFTTFAAAEALLLDDQLARFAISTAACRLTTMETTVPQAVARLFAQQRRLTIASDLKAQSTAPTLVGHHGRALGARSRVAQVCAGMLAIHSGRTISPADVAARVRRFASD